MAATARTDQLRTLEEVTTPVKAARKAPMERQDLPLTPPFSPGAIESSLADAAEEGLYPSRPSGNGAAAVDGEEEAGLKAPAEQKCFVGAKNVPVRGNEYTPPATPQRAKAAGEYLTLFGPFAPAYLERLVGAAAVDVTVTPSEVGQDKAAAITLFYDRPQAQTGLAPLVTLTPHPQFTLAAELAAASKEELSLGKRVGLGFGRFAYRTDAMADKPSLDLNRVHVGAKAQSEADINMAFAEHREALEKLDEKLHRHTAISAFGTYRLSASKESAALWSPFYAYIAEVVAGPLAAEYACRGDATELTLVQRATKSFGAFGNAPALSDKFYADTTRCSPKPDVDAADMQKHKDALAALDEKIVAAKETASAKNAEKRTALAAYVEQQKAEAPEPLEDIEDADADKLYLELIEAGVAQEEDLIARSESREAQSDLNTAVFAGIARSESELAMCKDALAAGLAEWGSTPSEAVDANEVVFPFGKCPVLGDNCPGLEDATAPSKSTVEQQLKDLDVGTVLEDCSSIELRGDKDEKPLDHELPEEGAWSPFEPMFEPLTEDDVEKISHVYDRVEDEPMFGFELPKDLSDVAADEPMQPMGTSKKAKKHRINLAKDKFHALWQGATFEEGSTWACVAPLTPLTEEELQFYFDYTPRAELDDGETALDCSVEGVPSAWLAIEGAETIKTSAASGYLSGVIAEDVCTEEQLATIEARKTRQKPVNAAARRQKLLHYFAKGSAIARGLPQEFLDERLAPTEEEMPAVLAAHKAKREAEKNDELEAPKKLVAQFARVKEGMANMLEQEFNRLGDGESKLRKPTKSSLAKLDGELESSLGSNKASDLRYPPAQFLAVSWPLDEAAVEAEMAIYLGKEEAAAR